ncbi:MAG: hypothetical protein J6X55_07200, partial [Victivallales bacterium]|nr:hypothetical protein [Victivallales bacterium]
MKKMLTLLTLACFGFAIAQEAPKPEAAKEGNVPPPPAKEQVPPPPAKPGQRFDRANMRAQILERQQKRLTTSAQEILAKYDTNKDGKLDDAEKTAMKADFENAEKLIHMSRDYRLIERIDANGDMILTNDELEKLPGAFSPHAPGGRNPNMRPENRPPRPPRRPPMGPKPPQGNDAPPAP